MPSAPPRPPVADAALHAHFPYVKDALTEDSDVVTDKTSLAALYRFDNPSIDNRLLRNLTSVANFKIRCQIQCENAAVPWCIPPSVEKSKHGYDLFLTFNLLAIAPSVRIEAHLTDRDEPETSPYHMFALEFPFNDRSGKQLHNFVYNGPDAITGDSNVRFSSTGATYEGVDLLPSLEDRFHNDEKEAITFLQTLTVKTTKEGQKQLHLNLLWQEMTLSQAGDFCKIMSRLPGGDGPLLPSIGVAEFSNYPIDKQGGLKKPMSLMTLPNPNLMVPLDCPNTFGSIAHFKADNLGFAANALWEGETALQLFAMCQHTVALVALNGKPVIALRYGNYPRNAMVDEGGVRLPNEFEIKIRFKIPGVEEEVFTAVRDLYLQGISSKNNAYFVISSHKLADFNGQYSHARDEEPQYFPVLSITPRANDFLLRSLAVACTALEETWHHRFHPIALGQSFNSLRSVDITSKFGVSTETRDEVWTWLKTLKPWNKKQRQIISQLKHAKGQFTIATGTAGTGKTTVQMALAVWFVKMGGRACCFATSNSNVNTQADALCEIVRGMDIRYTRIVSTARGIGFKYLAATQTRASKLKLNPSTVSTIYGMSILRTGQSPDSTDDWNHTVEAQMLQEADKKQLTFPFTYEGEILDAWEQFLKHLDEGKSDNFWDSENEDSDDNITKYAMAFEAAKGHLISLADIILTTNGNAQCLELKQHWAQVKNIKGLGVFIDEVGKEQEILVWNAILSAGLPYVPDFVMLLGDQKQLSPVNTSVTDGLQVNPFASRGSISMLDRLLALGWPHVHLDVQQRMHPALWYFPSKEFYGAESTTADGMLRSLQDVEPGLKAVLDGIIASSDPKEFGDISELDDVQSRLAYLDFGIQPVNKNESRSIAIPKHIQAVFELVLPALQRHFGDRTHREVMIIAAYGNSVERYHRGIHDLRELQELPPSYYPRILTVDSAQGQESKMVIVDNSMQRRDHMGFTTDRGRSNVAMTRAKEVFWVIGGPLDPLGHDDSEFLSPFPKLKEVMELADQVHKFSI